jgi:NSS family neurotransmitter:Na+ symporter
MPEREREQWGSRAGFVIAAVGSAIGLGNIWRFPYVAYSNGGGAFIVPYLVALLTAGLPLLVLEYIIGHRFRGSAPAALRRMSRPAEAIGWWQVTVCVVVASYYAVLIAWSARFIGYSIGEQWGDDPNGFLHQQVLQVAAEPGLPSRYIPGLVWSLLGVWTVTTLILAFGIRKGVEAANKILIPLLVALFGIIVVQALTLPGATRGLDALFAPNWAALADGRVWMAAYGQIFFSISVGYGIMITYASYLRRRSDLTGGALVAGFANSAFEILAGIGVFAALGFMSVSSGVAVSDVATSGIGLAFVAFPTIISSMPAGGSIFGIVFFGSLVIGGIASLISIVEVVVSAVQERTGLRRVPAVLGVAGVTALISLLLFPTPEGIYLLDVIDHFVTTYGVVLLTLVLAVAVAWLLRALPALQAHANATSVVRLGNWWRMAVGGVTPVVLGWMMWESLRTELAENYEGYPTSFLLVAGWAVAIATMATGVILSVLPRARRGDPADMGEPAFGEVTR